MDAFYQRDLKPWDWAAGALIAGEANAEFSTPHGTERRLMLAAAKGIYRELYDLVGGD